MILSSRSRRLDSSSLRARKDRTRTLAEWYSKPDHDGNFLIGPLSFQQIAWMGDQSSSVSQDIDRARETQGMYGSRVDLNNIELKPAI